MFESHPSAQVVVVDRIGFVDDGCIACWCERGCAVGTFTRSLLFACPEVLADVPDLEFTGSGGACRGWLGVQGISAVGEIVARPTGIVLGQEVGALLGVGSGGCVGCGGCLLWLFVGRGAS